MVVAIPEDTNANATRPVDSTFANSMFVRCVFLVKEDHTAFSADIFTNFVVRKMLLVVERWNLLGNVLSKSGMVIVCLTGENPTG